jgi:hypothetical protein
MAEPHTYTDSPVVERGHPLLGAFAPDGRIRIDGGPERLRQLLGHDFVGLVFATNATDAAAVVRAARSRPWHVAARLFVVLPPDVSPAGLPASVRVAVTEDGELARHYANGAGPVWWLARPDGHLAAKDERGERFASALTAAVGATGTDAPHRLPVGYQRPEGM